MKTTLARLFVLAAILSAPACSDSGGSSTVKKDSGVTDTAKTDSVVTDTKPAGDAATAACTGIFTGACGTCLEGACCAELAACDATTGCVDDITGGTACANAACTAAADAITACASASCETDCGGGGGGTPVDPLCTAPTTAPSGGSCFTLGSNACNPITNAGCTTAGAGCDLSDDGSFQCFDPPNDVALCGACDNGAGPFCKPTMHCVATTSATACARFCCNDADCAGGKCDTTSLGIAPVGVCVK